MKRKVPKPKKRKPYRDLPFEKMPAWYHELVYRSAAFNLSLRQLGLVLGKNYNTIFRVLKLENVQKAIAAEKARQRAPREKQLTAIDALAINRVKEMLEEGRAQDGVLASLAAKHLKGRGIYIDNEKVDHSGEIKVVIEKELVDKPAEKKE